MFYVELDWHGTMVNFQGTFNRRVVPTPFKNVGDLFCVSDCPVAIKIEQLQWLLCSLCAVEQRRRFSALSLQTCVHAPFQ
jgi:hypothetical protein